MTAGVVVFNAGSTSLKFAAYRAEGGEGPPLACRGKIDAIGSSPHFGATGADGKTLEKRVLNEGKPLDQRDALAFALDWLDGNVGDLALAAAGHRIVLGGARFAAPVVIDAETLDDLDGLATVETSHQRYNVAGARAFAGAFPAVLQVAVFDNAFHRTMPAVAKTYAIAPELRDLGVRHWGYHGISFEYISRQVTRLMPLARRVVVAHLGGGASLCAILDGRSVQTTMGFSALSGLPMATRCGDHLAYHIVKYVGAYVALLGGLDALVFTAGIGENSSRLRAGVCTGLTGAFGVVLDEETNRRNAPVISTEDSEIAVRVIPTDEELMIAEHTIALTGVRAWGRRTLREDGKR